MDESKDSVDVTLNCSGSEAVLMLAYIVNACQREFRISREGMLELISTVAEKIEEEQMQDITEQIIEGVVNNE